MVALPCSAEPVYHAGNKRRLQSGTGENDFKRVFNFRLWWQQHFGLGERVDGHLPRETGTVLFGDAV